MHLYISSYLNKQVKKKTKENTLLSLVPLRADFAYFGVFVGCRAGGKVRLFINGAE